MLTISCVRGGHVRVLLALGLVTFVAAGALLLAPSKSSGTQATAAVSAPDAVAGTAPGSPVAAKASPVTAVGSAEPIRIASLRDLAPAKFKHVKLEPPQEEYSAGLPDTNQPDGAVQKSAARNLMPGPIQNFDGIANLCGCYPPDVEGDVGPNHYMQWVNLHYAIYSKTGATIVPPTPGNTLFAGHSVCGPNNNGDPIVLYDQYAGRWNASQFGFASQNGPFYQCIAISDTSDPTGGWCTYQFQVHTTKFVDYPKLGVWPTQNSYTMTAPSFPGERECDDAGHLRIRARQDARLRYRTLRLPGHDQRADACAVAPGRRGRPDPSARRSAGADRYRQRRHGSDRRLERDHDLGRDAGDQRRP